MKNRISFVNPNYPQGPSELNAHYLPYSVGTLWAYCDQFDSVSNNFELNTYVWRREQYEDALERIEGDSVVGFSCYVWNDNYCKTLAEKIKQKNPDTLIIFGGPQPPIEKSNIFELYPFVDIFVKTEGEISFKRILESFEGRDFTSIPGLLLNNNGAIIDTGPAVRITDLDTIPSAYLNGYFDELMAEHPDVLWTGIFETNRGCPYQCTFCDWGSLTYSKVKKFDIDRVYAELEWFGQNNIDYIAITDANFGMFLDRDMGIAKKLVQVKNKYGNPQSYTISWAKNQRAEVIEIVKVLMFEGGSTAGLNVSVQSMDSNTLDIIKRKNLSMNKIEEVFDACEIEGIPLYTELILGLPGETLDSWKNNFYALYEAGNHTGVTSYQAQLLENAEMNLTQRNLYCLEGIKVYDYLANCETDDTDTPEGIEIVNSTLDLPLPKMLEAQMFSWYQNTFHINGLTSFISRFLKKHINESYYDFYDSFYSHMLQDEWMISEYNRVEHCYGSWLRNGKVERKEEIENIEIHGWNLIHSTLIKIHSDRKIDHVLNLIETYVFNKYKDKVDHDVLKQLITFQQNYVIDPLKLHSYPLTLNSKYDFLSYIQDVGELDSPATYSFEFPADKNMTKKTFCQKIFFDRRKNFGKAWITKL